MPFSPLAGPSPEQLRKLAGKQQDPQLRGDASVKLNVGNDGGAKLSGMGIAKLSGSSVSMPTNTTPTNAPGSASPVPVVAFPTRQGTPGITSPGTPVTAILNTAAALAKEDEWSPYPGGKPAEDVVQWVKGPDGVVRPTLTISGPNYVGPSGGGGAPPPPKEEPTPSYTSPPLVSAGPVKKSSPWLWLGIAAAAYAAFS